MIRQTGGYSGMNQAGAHQGSAGGGQPRAAVAQMAGRHRAAAAQAATQAEHALLSAFARMSAEWPGLGARAHALRRGPISVPEVTDLIEPAMFVALLQGPSDALGVAMICPALMAGLIEGATTGRILGAVPPGRAPTRTDAALVSPMLDALLDHIGTRCAGLSGAEGVEGYAYSSFLADPRPLALLLEDGHFHHIRYDVTLGAGGPAGKIVLILTDPTAAIRARPAPVQASAGAKWTDQMQQTVCASPVQLTAVLFKAQLSLSSALTLAPGDMLCIPASSLEALEIQTLDGTAIGVGRLGQTRGQRALRLTSDLSARPQPDAPAVPKIASMTPLVRGVTLDPTEGGT
jgi:flagellar motor switch protein FliM